MKPSMLVAIIATVVLLVSLAGCEQGDSGKVVMPEMPREEKGVGSASENKSLQLGPEISVVTLPGASSAAEMEVRESIIVRDSLETAPGISLDVRENIIVIDTPTVTPVATVVIPPLAPQPQLLSPPKLVSPGSESSPGPVISSLMPELQWSAVSGADGYGVYIFDVATKGIVFDSQVRKIDITGTSYIVPQGVLGWGKKYYWYMNTHNSAGWGTNSGPFYFQTQVPKQ